MTQDFTLEKDIYTYIFKAKSFPEGVGEAWDDLHKIFPEELNDRKFYGISYGSPNGITYFAAVEKKEADIDEIETFIIKAGNYKVQKLENYMDDLSKIGEVFQEMLKLPDIDPEGYCVEEYIDKQTMRCWVKLDS